MKIKKSIIITCVLCLVSCVLFVGNEVVSQEKKSYLRQTGDIEVNRISLADIGSYAGSIRASILRLTALNGLKDLDLDVVKKIDFSRPGDSDSGYGDGLSWEIYNQEGGKVDLNYPDKKVIQEHAYSDGFILSIANRVSGAGTDKADLIAILPFFKETSCKKVNGWIKNKTDGYSDVPKIANSPRLVFDLSEKIGGSIIELPYIEGPGQSKEMPYGCVEVEDKYYYYHVVYAF